MFIAKRRVSLDLQNNPVVKQEVRCITLLKLAPLIGKSQRLTRNRWNAALKQFYRERLMINRFEEPCTQFVVNGEASAQDFVAFVWIKEICGFSNLIWR